MAHDSEHHDDWTRGPVRTILGRRSHGAAQIIARYSPLKLGVWLVGVMSASAWLLWDGYSHGWLSLEGRYGWLRPIGELGCAYGLVMSLGLAGTFIFAGGAAITKVDDEFVFYFPFYRKRIAITPAVHIAETTHRVAGPEYGTGILSSRVRKYPVIAGEITVQLPGQKDLRFRTGLLSEKAHAIVEQMSALLHEKVGALPHP